MKIGSYAKKEIACQQIETALRLFFEKGDLFSVITLAGAAEEILGHLLQNAGKRRGLFVCFRAVMELLRPASQNLAEKARQLGEGSEAFVHLDPRQEAVFLLGRAIDDYQALSGALSDAMLRFNRELRAMSR